MKKNFKKVILWGVSIGMIGYILWIAGRLELHFYPHPYIDTEFTADSSLEKFNLVEIGMPEYQVHSMLGEPFSKHNYGPEAPDCWQYTSDGAAQPFDFSWFSHQVCFKEGKVISLPVNEFSD